MKFLFASAALAALTFTAAQAGEQPVRQMLYNVDSVRLCSAAANGQADFKDGLLACNTALRDPLAMHRAELLLDRGVMLT